MMKKMLLTVCGVVAFLAAVAAQQPPAASADTKPSAPAQVIEQLRGAAPAAATPADETPSLKTILDRYDAMVRAGAQAAAGQREIQASTVSGPPVSAADEGPAKRAVVAKPDGVPSLPLRSIIKELRTIVAQLEALSEESR